MDSVTNGSGVFRNRDDCIVHAFGASFRLSVEVFVFPSQANSPGPGEEAHSASLISYFPMLVLVVELNGGCSFNFEPAEFVQGHGISPKTLSGAIGVEGNCNCIHKSG